jgi:nucleoside-diphosphate-sugar epimerase
MKIAPDRRFLVTGATGNLGFAVVRRLLEGTACSIVTLVRPGSAPSFRRALAERFDVRHAAGERVILASGDMRAPFCGLDPASPVLAGTTDVIHCAADVRWHASADELIATNVGGASHLMDLCTALQRRRPLQRVTVVSSAYVSGRREGIIPETALDAPGFNNDYEASKLLAERLVMSRRDLPIVVVRPSILVGDSRDGSIENFTTVYFPFRMVQERKLKLLPGHRDAALDIVPVDHAADIIHAVHAHDLPAGSVVHACAGEDPVELPELWRIACDSFDELLPGSSPRQPGRIVPPGLVRAATRLPWLLPRKARPMLTRILLFLPYLSMRRRFAVDTARALGVAPPPPLRAYAPALCRFAVAVKYRASSRRYAPLDEVAQPIQGVG